MGSKNLNGVAVRGHQKVPIANNEVFQQALKAQVGAYKGNLGVWYCQMLNDT